MHLKRIEFVGFKSFASHTVADLPRGTVVVVGPNGSGKSNLADGLRWVLGEQSAKAVRARKPEEVIFAGSASKQPLGMAEVSLVLDNSDGLMADVPFADVRIARRLYRSGDSEYLLNNARVRLRDVTQHLLQAQLGPDSYCVISQGSVDELILQRPEERRVAFENAADVRRHQLSLADTRNKMAATHANLVRVQDVVAELAPHVRRLKSQADRAARAGTLRAELDQLLVRYYRYRLRLASLADAAAQTALDRASGALRGVEAEHLAAQQQLDQVDQQLVGRDERLAALRPKVDAFREQARAAERAQAVAYERTQALERQLATARQTQADAAGRLEALQGEQQALASTPEERPERVAELETAIAAANVVLHDRTQARQAHEAAVQQARGRAEALQRELAQLDVAVARAEERRRVTATEGEREAADQSEGARRLSELNQAVQQLAERMVEARNAVRAAEESARQALAQRGEAQRRADAAQQAARTARQRVDRLHGALRALGVGEAPGLSEPAPWPVDLGDLPVLGTAADLAQRVRPFSGLLAGYLGRILVLRTDESAHTAFERLRHAGGAGEAWGVMSASGLLLSPGGAAGVRTTTGSTEPVQDWGQALDAAEAELQQAEVELAGAQTDEASALAALEQARAAETRAASEVAAARPRVPQLEREQRSRAEELARFERERLRLAEQQHHAAEQRAREQQALEELLGRQAAVADRQRQAAVALAEIERSADFDRGELDALRTRLTTLQDERTRLRAAIEARQALRERVERDLRQAHAALEQAEARMPALAAQLAEARGQHDLAAGDLATARAALEPLAAELAQEEQQRTERLGARRQAEQRLGPLREQERAARAAHESAAVQAQRAADDLRRLREEVAQVVEDESDAEAQENDEPAPLVTRQLRLLLDGEAVANQEVEALDAETVRRRIATLQRELRTIGAVGDSVLAEYQEMKERHDFLLQQSHDLQTAMQELQQASEELESVLRERFAAVFESVNAAFQDCFKTLFGGGEAQLTLTQPDDLLRTGVDVVARPPGKKLQGLLSLSGGERALTVVALLFGLLRVNPTPFCVLDEVDAALDEANVQRFARLLRSFAERIQFIVVTHNRATMETADAMFGVTMDAQGVSHLLSVQPAAVARSAQSVNGNAG